MKCGMSLPIWGRVASSVRCSRGAEAAGYDSIWAAEIQGAADVEAIDTRMLVEV
jgi:hypothetical protein